MSAKIYDFKTGLRIDDGYTPPTLEEIIRDMVTNNPEEAIKKFVMCENSNRNLLQTLTNIVGYGLQYPTAPIGPVVNEVKASLGFNEVEEKDNEVEEFLKDLEEDFDGQDVD